MGSIIKNEFFKVFRSKAIYVMELIGIFLGGGILFFLKTLQKGVFGAEGIKETLTFYDGLSSFTNVIIFILSIWAVLLVTSMITEENRNGTLKYTLINPVTRIEVIIAKSIFLYLTLFIMVAVHIIIGIIASAIIVGGVNINDIVEILIKGILTTIPMFGLSMVLFIPALLLESTSHTIIIGFIITNFIDGVLRIKPAIHKYSITAYTSTFLNGNSEAYMITLILSAIYIIIFLVLSILLFNNKEIKA